MGIHFGVDYYPEHWPRERWETDAKLMKEMGVQVVRMAEFSWFKMEPAPGEFHFEWLEEAVALLDSYGIKTILGTPTAAPRRGSCAKIRRYSQSTGREGAGSLAGVIMTASPIRSTMGISNASCQSLRSILRTIRV